MNVAVEFTVCRSCSRRGAERGDRWGCDRVDRVNGLVGRGGRDVGVHSWDAKLVVDVCCGSNGISVGVSRTSGKRNLVGSTGSKEDDGREQEVCCFHEGNIV